MARLICLGAGIEGLPILERAKALGHELIVVDANPNAPGMALGYKCYGSCYDAADTLRTLEELTADGVLCCAVDAPHVAAAVAERFNLPGLTPKKAVLSVDKLAQKAVLRLHQLPVPEFHSWKHIVVKPPGSRGARGVKLIETGGMVEQYLAGPQLSTESIVQDGRVLFTAIGLRNYDRLAEFAPYIIEDGYDMPYGDAQLRADVDALLKRACAALGWDNLTVKGDWIIHDGSLVILELAARLSGGFFATHGIPLAYNLPFVDIAISLALGKRGLTLKWAGDPIRFICQRYVFPAPGDIGRRVAYVPKVHGVVDTSGLQSIMSKHGFGQLIYCDFATFAIHPSDTIQPVVSHGQRWGQATCTGSTPEQARARAESAVAAMKQAVVLG